ncbi:MAG: hypothetical protein UY44_C0002G0035 [Candidatus Kaiserbacteria bacterium GW2011_GWA2_49_19]|uniref:Uncharacterized protein n=1 Tax=Candidatus Kaiserbacteria bacterium GW2011_GWA2_49_19 TaxID=1618669 RepID=A0A0G1VSY5_9BACT|nr:MAG: hypothetical protein UY44_C0002G0035 [Candidatus Kaiserbacteria bacterium GW2011_GWA2_49_19]
MTKYIASDSIIGLKELRDNDDLEDLDGPGWKTLVDFTKIKKGGVPIDDVIASLERTHGQGR